MSLNQERPTKALGFIISAHEDGLIEDSAFYRSLQDAIDNGDILEPGNTVHVISIILPLVDEGVLDSSDYLIQFREKLERARSSIGKQSKATTIKEVILGLGGWLVMFAFIVGIISLLVFGMQRIPWFQENVEPWINLVCMGIFFVVLPISLILVIFKRTRPVAGLGLMISSYVFGFANWIWCFTVCYFLAGTTWTIVGLFFLGVGVYPIALVASILTREWWATAVIVFSIIIIFGLRAWANFLLSDD